MMVNKMSNFSVRFSLRYIKNGFGLSVIAQDSVTLSSKKMDVFRVQIAVIET
jgi:hypothetical protein